MFANSSCRSVWHHPLRLDNKLYIEVVFNQIAPDYLEGLLLVMPSEQIDQDIVYQVAKVAALLHKAADMDHVPTLKVRNIKIALLIANTSNSNSHNDITLSCRRRSSCCRSPRCLPGTSSPRSG